MLDKVKTALRITTDAFNEEIEDLISAAMADLQRAGVTEANDYDPLIVRAIITYCRANFGSPEDAERMQQAYEAQREVLMHSSGYTDWGR